jgi:Putative metal-binding motif/Secretion system C-terminal sorting domain
LNSSDCNDTDPLNLTGNIPYYADLDGDGYGNSTSIILACVAPLGYVANNTDCLDTNAAVHPGAIEVGYDGLDNNCNGTIDEGFPTQTTILNPASCGLTLSNITQSIAVYSVIGATGFRFEVKNLTTGAIQTIDRIGVTWFRLTQLPNYDYATSYQVRVMIQKAGIWLGYYGNMCTITTPLNNSNIQNPACGSTLLAIHTSIASPSVLGATGYRFRVTRATSSGPEVQIFDTANNWMKLNQLMNYVYGTAYTFEVAIKTSGYYTPYSNACTINSPALPTMTSCGAVVPASNIIYTTPVLGAQSYTFEVTSNSGTQVINRLQHWFPAAAITGYSPSIKYSIRVAVTTTGILSDYGSACFINPSGARFGVATATSGTTTGTEFKAVGYPNPFETSFTLDVTTASDAKIQVVVYDMIGKELESKEVTAADANSMQVGAKYPSGVYNVVVSQGANVKSLRMIKR